MNNLGIHHIYNSINDIFGNLLFGFLFIAELGAIFLEDGYLIGIVPETGARIIEVFGGAPASERW